ncbi:MAG: hypothetical protein IKN54_02380 [Lachnospiraceae bacterium]|nr:hypothetical protein [Lachnospiraceae bacterium]
MSVIVKTVITTIDVIISVAMFFTLSKDDEKYGTLTTMGLFIFANILGIWV